MCHISAADSKEPAGAPAENIKVTAEMIRAGFAMLYAAADSDFRPALMDDRDLKAVYIAMRRLEPEGQPCSSQNPKA